MPVVRIYLPVGRTELAELADTGYVPATVATPREAFAVTEALVAGAPNLDDEDLEYAAFTDAVLAAGAVLADPGDRRVVLAADADPAWVAEADGRPVSRVWLVAPLPVSRVSSFHIDELAGAARTGAGGARAADEADELLWYDITELDEVRALLG